MSGASIRFVPKADCNAISGDGMSAAVDIADRIVRFRADDVGVPIDPLSLEKHLFYAQSFWLVLSGRPLFDDDVEAWRNGPVVPEVYHAYRAFGSNPVIPAGGRTRSLGNGEIEAYLEEVVDFLGGYSAFQLSRATHAEEPWQNVRGGVEKLNPSSLVIPKMEMCRYYSQLMSDGEDALSRQQMLGILPEPRWGWMYVSGISARKMSWHPFYHLMLAERLLEFVPAVPARPFDFHQALARKEYLDIGDVSGLNWTEISERVKIALDGSDNISR
jgi:uncharacterized phage-associated protein